MYDVFNVPDFTFPKGFLWGSATAGHQIEGDNTNSQRWHEEHQPDFDGVPSGKACNHYQLFKQDAQMVHDLGHQAYRMSLEWSRMEPICGTWDEDAFLHYEQELQLYKKLGIKTFVTLTHFTWPQWFEELGGVSKKDNFKYFMRFAEKAVKRYDGLVDFWLVLNEKTHTLLPDGLNFIRLHAETYRLIKTLSKAPVSSAHMALQYWPYRYYDELDNTMAAYKDFQTNGAFLHAIRTGELIAPHEEGEDCPEAKGAVDFWALNLYTRELVDARKKNLRAPRFPHKFLPLINKPFYFEEFFPEGCTAMIERFRDYPVYMTENGCCCNDDRFRIVYIVLYLSALHDALKRGVDLRGYLYWSLMDNYEWSSFLPRFGLVDVDFENFKRTPKSSAYFYKEIIENNGFSQKILRKYLAELPTLTM
ncbi:MAG: glycoside hydrolase family 1 protein [Victivallales bacterium]|nr:glycoside hydrolase family 1 protein [Victivallales bacterium]